MALPDRPDGNDRHDAGGHTVEEGAGGLESVPAGSSPPPEELSLEDIPLRGQLTDPTIFDALARLEHKAKPYVEALEKLLEADPTIRHYVESADARAGSLAVLIHRLVKVLPREKWVLCWRCHGKGKTPHGKGCMTCRCAGCVYE